ncbi:potassium channel family protein [Geminocystis sp. CENA526]|uniref:potassium channel family protein n=1 Tax=Geminocystis sp. CENA526 TaxID=1355871 RepID=UPI003D70067D
MTIKIVKNDKNKYTSLFINLIIFFLLLPLSDYIKHADFLFPLSLFLIIIFAIKTLNFPQKIIKLFFILTALSFFTNLLNLYDQSGISRLLTFVTNIFDIIFLTLSILSIYHKINSETKVNNDVLRGGVCIYLMLGIIWYLFYTIIYFFDINAFHFPDYRSSSENINLFYFSFVTLTTVGYGDITPVNNFAMIFSNLEGLFGQLFPAISIATLVSLYKK